MPTGFASIDDYLGSFPPQVRAVLDEVRTTIREALPDAAETISYGIPTFTIDGDAVIYFAGWKHHVSLYPVPAGDAAYTEAIAPFVAGKGTLRFPLGKPIPLDLVARTARLQAQVTSPEASPAEP